MFKKPEYKRSTNIPFVIFRLLLSIVMFVVLLVGIYSAYKHFTGMDPLKLDFIGTLNRLVAARTPKQLTDALSSFKIDLSQFNLKPKTPNKPSDQIDPGSGLEIASNNQNLNSDVNAATANILFRFLLIADSHNDNDNLDKAIKQATSAYPDLKFIIGLGDYTEVGTIEELKNTKAVLDSFALRYFLVPGDHDLWDCRNRNLVAVDCFKEVFGLPYQTFTYDDFKFLLIDNSDNYQGLDSNQLEWIAKELDKAKLEGVKGIIVLMHEPLYHPSSEHVMGSEEKKLKPQANELIFQLKEAGVNKIFAGHTHYFSEYIEPKTQEVMVTIGSASTERNPQVPRFAVVSVFDNGFAKAEDIEIK